MEGVNESDQFQGASEALRCFLSLRGFVLRWKFYLEGNRYTAQDLRGDSVDKRLLCKCEDLGSNPQNSHKARCISFFPVISTLQPRHRREKKEEESLEACGPASLAYTPVKKRLSVTYGRMWRLSLVVALWPPHVVHGTCMPTFTHTNTTPREEEGKRERFKNRGVHMWGNC